MFLYFTATPASSVTNPQLSRLNTSITTADSPLLAQLMESPFTSSNRQTLYAQVRKLKLQVSQSGFVRKSHPLFRHNYNSDLKKVKTCL